ncbi:hypothetical protein KA057_02690 [Candidatus Gracilibacteria bacterium]|nr:hypothetical protein [Candidatus Gracilibacteria bacterium]
MSTKYTVIIRDFAQRHFIDEFEKKHKKAWSITWTAYSAMLSNIEELLKTTKAEKIYSKESEHIVKCEFAVAGRGESPHASGNRMIVYMNTNTCICEILLVYGKNNVSGSHETAWWHNLIFDQCDDLRILLGNKR